MELLKSLKLPFFSLVWAGGGAQIYSPNCITVVHLDLKCAILKQSWRSQWRTSWRCPYVQSGFVKRLANPAVYLPGSCCHSCLWTSALAAEIGGNPGTCLSTVKHKCKKNNDIITNSSSLSCSAGELQFRRLEKSIMLWGSAELKCSFVIHLTGLINA